MGTFEHLRGHLVLNGSKNKLRYKEGPIIIAALHAHGNDIEMPAVEWFMPGSWSVVAGVMAACMG